MSNNLDELKAEFEALSGKGNEPKQDPWAALEARFAEEKEEERQMHAELKVCGTCYRRQSKDNTRCELCNEAPQWRPSLMPTTSREAMVRASTTDSVEELQARIANEALKTELAAHSIRVLKLMGIEPVRSFWQRAGFDVHGHALGSDVSGR